jgi:predicted nucleic acid-binding protein
MIVLDASAAVDWLLQTPAGRLVENRIYSHNETLMRRTFWISK